MQIKSLETKLQTLCVNRDKVLKERQLAEEKYSSKATEYGEEANDVRIYIQKARKSPQDLRFLQAIYVTHTEVVANDKNIKDTEQQLAALNQASSERDKKIASQRAVLEQKVVEVLARLWMYACYVPNNNKKRISCSCLFLLCDQINHKSKDLELVRLKANYKVLEAKTHMETLCPNSNDPADAERARAVQDQVTCTHVTTYT